MESEFKEVNYSKLDEWKSTVIEEKTNELKLKIERQPHQHKGPSEDQQQPINDNKSNRDVNLNNQIMPMEDVEDKEDSPIYAGLEQCQHEYIEQLQPPDRPDEQLQSIVVKEERLEDIVEDVKNELLEELSGDTITKSEKDDDSDMLSSNIDDEQDGEEVEDKEKSKVEGDEASKEAQDSQYSKNSPNLGRNRRVRQKNRYFLDFHCIDLAKGARSNKDEFDTFTSTTTTRSSNRRSTTDSNRGHQDEPEVESKYCRKCLNKTPHDIEGGCQACLYKKIVESSRRQKPSSQRSRSTNSRQNSHQHANNNNQSKSSTSSTTSQNNKRKASSKQSRSKISVSGSNNNIGATNINNNNNSTTSNTNNNFLGIANDNNFSSGSATNTRFDYAITRPTSTTSLTSDNTSSEATLPDASRVKRDQEADISNINNLPRLDSWTPDEVAEYISSKGFVDEAELFKNQCVDGISLLLMQRNDFTYGLKIKLGPALEIYDQVCKLKRDYLRTN